MNQKKELIDLMKRCREEDWEDEKIELEIHRLFDNWDEEKTAKVKDVLKELKDFVNSDAL